MGTGDFLYVFEEKKGSLLSEYWVFPSSIGGRRKRRGKTGLRRGGSGSALLRRKGERFH